MNRTLGAALVLITTLSLACGNSVEIDEAAEREALMQADRDFAADTAARGGDGWADWFAEDGLQFPSTGRIEGREAIRERMRAAFTPENPRMVWEPETAVVSEAGDLGYTIGRWRSLPPGSDDIAEATASGSYVSIWRKDPSGRWRVAVDIGNEDAKPPAPGDAGG